MNWLEFLPFVAVGFVAQMVDGALGMAFGVISNTLLVSLGLPPAAASARVHIVETFTTAASGISHILHRNVDWSLFSRLAIPGMIGGALGAYVLTSVDASIAKPVVLAYLASIGIYLIWRGFRHVHKPRAPRIIAPLGFIGGFMDASGGGGWGPIVTSNLLVQGADPRRVIGTVNTSEFLLTLVISGTFIFRLGLASFTYATVGLLVGGLAAAPLGAFATKHVSARPLLVMVGVILTATSLFGLYRALA
jgi:uncharacterized protein